jgi:HEAT repeat protein
MTSRDAVIRQGLSLRVLAVCCISGWAVLEAAGCGGGVDPTPHAAATAVVDSDPAPPVSLPEPVIPAAAKWEMDEQLAHADQAFAALTAATVTPEEWDAAHNRLVAQGPAAVKVLAGALAAADPLRREMAAALLAGLGPDAAKAAGALTRALNDESPFVRANAATALCCVPGHEADVIPVLTRLLASDDPQLRQMAATNLANFGPEAAPFVPQLAHVLDDGASDVVVPVVELLGRIGPAAESAVPRLQQIVFEQDGEARTAATAALEQITPPARE